jgi:arylsulfatase A-like enzyme
MYRPEQMPRPAAFVRDDWRPSPFVERLLNARASGKANVSSQAAFAVSECEALEARALSCGMIAMIDDAIGVSDHGDYLGDHRILLKGSSLYQGICRTPFIWSDPESPVRGVRSDALGSTLDVAATVLERAGLAPYAGMQGVSLLDTLQSGREARDSVMMQYDHQFGPSRPGRMLRTHGLVTKDWRVSMAEGLPGGELYHLAKDAEEFFNLWDDRQALEGKCDMLARLARAEMEYVDELPLPTGRA